MGSLGNVSAAAFTKWCNGKNHFGWGRAPLAQSVEHMKICKYVFCQCRSPLSLALFPVDLCLLSNKGKRAKKNL